jgi:cysteine desulfurase family protein
MIYFDNAATSWPKPDVVIDATVEFLRDLGANPGRSGHRLSVAAERIRFEAREHLCSLFGASDPTRLIFTLNVTEAINLVLFGYVSPGDRVVTTSMEHNAVLRPLRFLEGRGVEVVLVPCGADGTLQMNDMEAALRGGAKMVVASHASNVCGTLIPAREIGALTRESGIPFLVDTAQTAGSVPMDMKRDNIDILTFTGHKGLLGPTGTGGVVFAEDFDVESLSPLVFGGTGSRSEEEYQPDFLPDKYESGTANIVGIAGLGAGVGWIRETGVEKIREHEKKLTRQLIAGLSKNERIKIVGTKDADRQTATVSFMIDGISTSEVGRILGEEHDIMCRVGLHCAPRAHRTLLTFPEGTVRFGLGFFNTIAEVDRALEAVFAIAGEG